MGVVYKATNLVNGKIYIGKTISSLHKRKKDHIWRSKNLQEGYLFHKAINKYGENSFVWDILIESSDFKFLDKKEIEYISNYKSNDRDIGYNLTDGGEGTPGRIISEETRENHRKSYKGNLLPYITGENHYLAKLTNEKVIEIRKLLYTTDMSYQDIADKYGIKNPIIYGIAKNQQWKDVGIEQFVGMTIIPRLRKSVGKRSKEKVLAITAGIRAKSKNVKLTPEKVRSIRRLYGHHQTKKIASWFDIDRHTVIHVINKTIWKDIE